MGNSQGMPEEKRILRQYKTVAVVGLSADALKASFRVARFLADQGFNIIPVNPTITEVMERRCYPDLVSIKEPVEIVDIFRTSDKVSPVVDEAINIKAKVIWMQEGIINEEAAARARAAGLTVIMDRCMMRMYKQFFLTPNPCDYKHKT